VKSHVVAYFDSHVIAEMQMLCRSKGSYYSPCHGRATEQSGEKRWRSLCYQWTQATESDENFTYPLLAL